VAFDVPAIKWPLAAINSLVLKFEGAAHQVTSSHIKHRTSAHQTHIKPHININKALGKHIKDQRPGLRGVCVGCKECESTKSHAVEVVSLCKK
jgi:hypothetical protein